MYNTVPARTPPKSPSSELSASSSQSSRDSSPVLQLFSAATSSSDIDQICGTPDSRLEEHQLLSMVMEHHNNHPFDFPNSLRNKIRGIVEAGTTTSTTTTTPTTSTTTTTPTTSPSPRTSGFYNNNSLAPVVSASSSSASQAATPRNTIVPGNNSGALFPNRNLTSANWRNTNIAASQNNNQQSSFLFPYSSSSNEPATILPTFSHYNSRTYNLPNRSPPDPTRTMSSPTFPEGNTSPTANPTGQLAAADAGTDTNNPRTGAGNSNNGDTATMALEQISKALVQTTMQQQQQQLGGGRSAGHREMPFYAYCFDRGNGQYTRLIPADMMPPLVDIPAIQLGCLGMTVLPCPTGLAPNGRSSNLERVFVQPTQQFGGALMRSGNPRDPVQSRIDTIIAASPAPEAQKRQKIYCDKWIHEGVCAFTQQGCKYKHEMPLDQPTQEALGLFHGLPTWWRKHQGEITSELPQQAGGTIDGPPPMPPSSTSALSSSSGGPRARGMSGTGRGGFGGATRLRNNTWRSGGSPAQVPGRVHSASVSSASGAVGGGGGHSRQQQQQQVAVAQFSSPFGPIAPPSASTRREFEHAPNMTQPVGRNPFVDHNPWNALRTENGSDGSEEGAKLG